MKSFNKCMTNVDGLQGNIRPDWYRSFSHQYAARDKLRYLKVKVPHLESVKHDDRVMVAKNEFFNGCATWKFEFGVWICRRADDCLKFLLKKNVPAAKLELVKRGFEWKWL